MKKLIILLFFTYGHTQCSDQPPIDFTTSKWTIVHFNTFLDLARKALKSENPDPVVVNRAIKEPHPSVVSRAIRANINTPEIQEKQTELFKFWIDNNATLLSYQNFYKSLDALPVYGYRSNTNDCFDTLNPIVLAAYLKNFKLAQQLIDAKISMKASTFVQPLFKDSRHGDLFYFLIITHSNFSQYDLEFFLKNNASMSKSFESLETVKIARENIERRKCINRFAASRRRQNKKLPILVQKIIFDFLQPKIYDNETRRNHDHANFMIQERIESEKQRKIEIEEKIACMKKDRIDCCSMQ